MRRTRTPFSFRGLLLNAFVVVPTEESDAPLLRDHQRAHGSRFEFTVLHGHHHDAVPAALIGGPGQGFGEAFHESLSTLLFLQGTVLSQLLVAIAFFFDMVGHQYIPGVFPYTRLVIVAQLHHVVHHYGSVRPLGLAGAPYKLDVEAGYRPDNPRTRWFVDVARRYEHQDAILYARFPHLPGATSAEDTGARREARAEAS